MHLLRECRGTLYLFGFWDTVYYFILYQIPVASQVKTLNANQHRSFNSSVILNVRFNNALRQEDKDPPSGTSGGKGPGKGKDGQLCCPKCGKPCTHVETFVCKYQNVQKSS